MPRTSPYRARGRTERSRETRSRIMDATRELLNAGTFHEATVEEVAEKAGVSRATLYQHFPSRLDLVDTMCDTFAENPALVSVRKSVELPDLDDALEETIGDTVRFWSSEYAILRQLYGASAVDPAARDLVERQLSDRRGEMQKLVRRLDEGGILRSGLERGPALAHMLVVTSFGTYSELHQEGLSDAKLTRQLQADARLLLLGKS